ncbi:cellulose biosynthesis protein BcsE [Pseudoalteromonas sp. MMG010]|uniref:cellulose biosynthesis protein BcsE n=1 Tax=Pseudoalteromonas sp. MMG010 TaxID=2822685 RepID=UPI001B39D5D0|nr:cellulose biosynthesis protein BcsE [Pseudoalteromonas sp. MMG010]
MHRFNIDGLQPAAQELANPGGYILLSPINDLVLDYALQAVNYVDDTQNVFMLAQEADVFFETDYSQSLITLYESGRLHPFSFSEKSSTTSVDVVLSGLIRELSSYHKIKHSLTILHFNFKDLASLSTQNFESLIVKLNRFALKFNITLLLLLTGPDTPRYRELSKSLNRHLNGIAFIYKDSSVNMIDYDYWSHKKGVLAQTQYTFTKISSHIVAEKPHINEQLVHSQFQDEDNVWLVKNCVPEGTKLPALFLTVENNEDLLKLAEDLNAATLVFSVTRYTDLVALAKMCFELRNKGGRWLKLVIQNVDGIIRHQDECLFLTLGVNLILYSYSEPSRLFSQIQSIQGFQFSRQLPSNVDEILTETASSLGKGYLPFYEFIQQVEENSEAAVNLGISGVLVLLELLPRIEAIHPLHLFHIKREGDIISAAGNSVYLYLHACREHDVDKAIKHLFKLNLKEFFTQTEVISEHFYIQQSCKQQRKLFAGQDIPDYTNQLMEHIYSPSVGKTTEEAPVEFRTYERPAATRIKLQVEDKQ